MATAGSQSTPEEGRSKHRTDDEARTLSHSETRGAFSVHGLMQQDKPSLRRGITGIRIEFKAWDRETHRKHFILRINV
jgi:hypothetical protein